MSVWTVPLRLRIGGTPIARISAPRSRSRRAEGPGVISNAASPPDAVKRIIRGLGLVLSGKAGAGVLSLGYLAIAARLLGPSDYGVLVLVHGYVTAVCALVEFPAWQAILRYGAQAHREDSPHRLARLLRFSAAIELTGGALAILTAALLAPIIGPKLGWSPTALAFAVPYSFALLGSIRSTPAGYLQLIGRFDLIGAHNLVMPALRLGGVLLIWLLGGGLGAFLIVWMAAAIAEFASLWLIGLWFASRRLGATLRKPERGSAIVDNPGIWRFLAASNADVTLSGLSGRVAPLLIGWMMGPAAAGFFAIASRATVLIAQPAQVLGNTAYAEFARLIADGKGGRPLRRALLRLLGIAFAAVIPLLALVVLYHSAIVRLLAGASFSGAGGLMVMLLIARALAMAGPPTSAALSALGKPAWSVSANLVASLIFLPALIPLLQVFGLKGAAFQAIGQALLASGLLLALTWLQSKRYDRTA